MEVQSSSMKRNYDITMSRRTRKQSFQVQVGNEEPPLPPISVVFDTTKDDTSLENSVLHEVKEDENENDHKSLKQLIIGDEKDAIMKCNSDEGGGKGGRNSLSEHFTEEEKNLQLVRVQQKDNIQGMKFKKLVRRYAKVLGHLMKAKRDPHLGEAGKKPPFKLSS
ncbi:hypothetical protein TanjilG_20215 [Lupinus angustifolius]|uniref:Uncharacterized protein n=1 Tax=Lupinus angustifolius TaxID=3871 RepID=A0A1J7IFY3_LUPAN|nr:PREDICTED: uncharacterized protein LOC109347961 [Lupinus angustifolius]OIW11731.1 hypothetical protein TanjilG_20215 [Lupinus angustifolius]